MNIQLKHLAPAWVLLLVCETRAKDDLSPLETHYFDYLTYYEPDGLSLRIYCEEKGISYEEKPIYNFFRAYFCSKAIEGLLANLK